MNKPHLLQKLAPVGVAAIGAIAVIGITPAQAQLTGGLDWGNGTSDFFTDVTPGAGDNFSVEFKSPLFTEELTEVDAATGLFDSFFGPFPDIVTLLPEVPTGNFSYSVDQSGLGLGFFRYTLTNDIVFNFDPDDDTATEVSVTIGNGSTFVGTFDDLGGVEFLDETVVGEIVNIDGTEFTIGGTPNNINGFAFAFEDIELEGNGGEYGGITSVVTHSVPEPATILGLLAFGGLSLGLKRKEKSLKAG